MEGRFPKGESNILIPMMRHYILKDSEVHEVDMLEWAEWFNGSSIQDRVVAKTWYGPFQCIEISTVFLGIDHNFIGAGEPHIFETMVFGGLLSDEQERYGTLENAMLGHERMVAKVRKTENPISLLIHGTKYLLYRLRYSVWIVTKRLKDAMKHSEDYVYHVRVKGELYRVILRPGEDGFIVAIAPDLLGVISQGKYNSEALLNIKEAIALYLEDSEDDNL